MVSSQHTSSATLKNKALPAAALLGCLSFFVPACAVYATNGNAYFVWWHVQFGSWSIMILWFGVLMLSFLSPKTKYVVVTIQWAAAVLSFVFLLHQTVLAVNSATITAHAGFWMLWIATVLLFSLLVFKIRG